MSKRVRLPYRLSRCESVCAGIRWLGNLPGHLTAIRKRLRRSQMSIDLGTHMNRAPEERNIFEDAAPLERTNRSVIRFFKHLAPLERIRRQLRDAVNFRLAAQLLMVLTAAAALKYFYSTASVNELRWILAPTTFLVELISGQQFHFESYAGYINQEHTVVIAASCAGVNFLLTAFLLLALRTLWRGGVVSWRQLGMVAVVAYCATIIANTFRITTALQMLSLRVESSWLNANELHRLEGIFVYFGFLLLLYLSAEIVSDRKSWSSLLSFRRLGFPLAIYYATTLGLPFINGAFRQTEFWQHAAFVLLTPLVVLLPLTAVLFLARRSRAIRFS